MEAEGRGLRAGNQTQGPFAPTRELRRSNVFTGSEANNTVGLESWPGAQARGGRPRHAAEGPPAPPLSGTLDHLRTKARGDRRTHSHRDGEERV